MTLCMKCSWRRHCGLQSLIQVALLWLIYVVKTKSLQAKCALYLLLELRKIMHSFVRHQACEAWEKMVTWTRCIHVLIHNPTQLFLNQRNQWNIVGRSAQSLLAHVPLQPLQWHAWPSTNLETMRNTSAIGWTNMEIQYIAWSIFEWNKLFNMKRFGRNV